MQRSLTDGLLKVCEILNRHSVEYLIVGGTAVALHGFYRASLDLSGKESEKPDLDFWYNPTYQNYFSLLKSLADLGQDVSLFQKEKAPQPKKSFFRFDIEQFTLDFLPNLKAPLSFRSSYNKKESIEIGDIKIFFICYEDLLTDKAATGRQKDLRDIDELKQRNSHNE